MAVDGLYRVFLYRLHYLGKYIDTEYMHAHAANLLT